MCAKQDEDRAGIRERALEGEDVDLVMRGQRSHFTIYELLCVAAAETAISGDRHMSILSFVFARR